MYGSHADVYGPSKPSNWLPIEAWLFPTASMVGLGEKLRMDPRVTQPVWDCVKSPSSWEQCICSNLLVAV
jgi:hypothetical protein